MSNNRPGYHQDYIARIRYTNALPPPPFAPKLLEIANSGLSSGQYTSASFASRLAREQPLNIEADAELGMKIDLVGLPGVFDGDEKAIMFPDHPGPIDPRDRALLRPLSSLGKSSAAPSSVSFLRRTEYITAHKTDGMSPARPNSALLASKARNAAAAKAAPPRDKNDPAAMLRTIEKSFNLAYPKDAYTGPDSMDHIRGSEIMRNEREAWERPKHPTKPDLKLLDSYPVLPDIASLGETGSYFLLKYNTNPSVEVKYDPRLDVAVLVAKQPTDEEVVTYQAEMEKHQADPAKYPKIPQLMTSYTAYLPEGEPEIMIPRLKRKFDIYDADNDEADLYTHGAIGNSDDEDDEVAPYFKYTKLRPYETHQQQGGDTDELSKWNVEVGVALHDPESTPRSGSGPKRQKAAYVYPINQKTFIRPKRPKTKGVGMMALASQSQVKGEVDDDSADILELRIGQPDEEMRETIAQHKLKLDSDWAE